MAGHRPLDLAEQSLVLRRRPTSSVEASPQTEAAPHPLLHLQRLVGNAQVARMLTQREEIPEEDEELVQAKHDPALAQREGLPEEEDEELLQADHDSALASAAEVGPAGGPVSDALAGRIAGQRGGGAPLDDGMRAPMESAFGTSFADVRVHTGAEADALNRSVSARAFASGNDLFFGQSASPSDGGLLAHELTHVVQQRGMDGAGPMTVSPAGDTHEQEADDTATAVAATLASGAAQREPESDEA